jgi:glyoxylase-like metal-dependent hydrolase (beta-lactamase superfamily II)
MSQSLPRLTKFADGITAVDTEYVRPQMDAAHIVASGLRAAIVDTGPNTAVPLVLAGLAELGIERDAVEFCSSRTCTGSRGGAGALMRELPRATAVLHPRGAPHMADPRMLIEGTRAVYGPELYAQLYGEILPIERERIAIAQDGQRFELAGRVFECIHTPVHALHHQCVVDHGAASVFTGDTFGLSYREFDTVQGPWIMPTTTPTQFDPSQLKASIVRIMQFRPRRAYLTHYSEVGDCARLANDMYDAVDEYVRIARAADLDTKRMRYALRSWALFSLRAHGVTLSDDAIDSILDKDFELNAAGLAVWLKREAN